MHTRNHKIEVTVSLRKRSSLPLGWVSCVIFRPNQEKLIKDQRLKPVEDCSRVVSFKKRCKVGAIG